MLTHRRVQKTICFYYSHRQTICTSPIIDNAAMSVRGNQLGSITPPYPRKIRSERLFKKARAPVSNRSKKIPGRELKFSQAQEYAVFAAIPSVADGSCAILSSILDWH